jgi:uncharacterized protein (TIGR02996 family)
MSDRDALLRAILAAPGDDTPRLVYADWLTERGEESRAEFIRVQCEVARLAPVPTVGARPTAERARIEELRRRERELLRTMQEAGENWFPIPGFARHVGYEWSQAGIELTWWPEGDSRGVRVVDTVSGGVRRGFVDSLSLPLRSFTAHAAAIFREHPVRSVRLTDRNPVPTPVFECGHADDMTPVYARRDDPPYRWLFSTRNAVGHPESLLTDFPTEDAARQALSVACVNFGRRLAGLPELPERLAEPLALPR